MFRVAAAGFGAVSVALLLTGTSVTAATVNLPGFEQLDDYLIVGMANSGIADSVNIQNTEIGADRQFLSDGSSVPNSQSEASPNTKSVFYQGGDRWTSASAPPAPASNVFQGIDYSGNVAVTSATGDFSMSNVDVYANIGVDCDAASCADSVSNTTWFQPTETIPGGSAMPASGVNDIDSAALLDELNDWSNFIEGLSSEFTITSNIVNENRNDGSGPFITDLDANDTNNDGLVVIDIDRGDNDFELNNSDWILDGTSTTLAIFRILNGSNFNLSNSSILLGGGIGDTIDDQIDLIDSIGAIFYVGSGESSTSGNSVFNFNNVVLNGIGIWDLANFGGGIDEDVTRRNMGLFDDGTTEIVVNNGQGCAQFISSKVNFNDVRWNRCALGSHDIPPIPLPAAAWMMIAALGGLGALRMRRS